MSFVSLSGVGGCSVFAGVRLCSLGACLMPDVLLWLHDIRDIAESKVVDWAHAQSSAGWAELAAGALCVVVAALAVADMLYVLGL